MDGPLLDHSQWFMVILYHDMTAIDVGMELLQTKAHGQTLSLNVCRASLTVSMIFTGKCYWATTSY